jgi:ketosteroid isomerase-like protein
MFRTSPTALRLCILPVLLGTLAGMLHGQQAKITNAQSAASDEARIRKRLAQWVEQTRAGDRVAAAEIWAPDLVGWYPGQPDDSYAREQESARRPQPTGAPRSIPAVTLVEVVVSGDLAVLRDIWDMSQVAGTDTTRQSLRSYEVWRRQPDGAWRIARWISAPEPARR